MKSIVWMMLCLVPLMLPGTAARAFSSGTVSFRSLQPFGTDAIDSWPAVCFCHPSPPPYLFGPRSLVERAWRASMLPGRVRHCRGKGGTHGAVCGYRSGSRSLVVTYGSKNQVVTFELLEVSRPLRAHTWALLVGLLPGQAHAAGCSVVQHWKQGGVATVCGYQYAFEYSDGRLRHEGYLIVVARYHHPRADGPYGVVEPEDGA